MGEPCGQVRGEVQFRPADRSHYARIQVRHPAHIIDHIRAQIAALHFVRYP